VCRGLDQWFGLRLDGQDPSSDSAASARAAAASVSSSTIASTRVAHQELEEQFSRVGFEVLDDVDAELWQSLSQNLDRSAVAEVAGFSPLARASDHTPRRGRSPPRSNGLAGPTGASARDLEHTGRRTSILAWLAVQRC